MRIVMKNIVMFFRSAFFLVAVHRQAFIFESGRQTDGRKSPNSGFENALGEKDCITNSFEGITDHSNHHGAQETDAGSHERYDGYLFDILDPSLGASSKPECSRDD
jgi:hypothetical protein